MASGQQRQLRFVGRQHIYRSQQRIGDILSGRRGIENHCFPVFLRQPNGSLHALQRDLKLKEHTIRLAEECLMLPDI